MSFSGAHEEEKVKDINRTKKELLDELKELHQRVSELEESESEREGAEKEILNNRNQLVPQLSNFVG